MAVCPNCSRMYLGPPHHEPYHVVGMGPYAERLRGAAPARPDEDIRRDLERALFYDTWVDSSAIQANVSQGVVTLTGTVIEAAEKRAAGDDAWNTWGVRNVKNEIQVQE